MSNDSKLKLEVILSTLDKASAPLRRVNSASRDAADALRETRDALKSLEKQQSSIQGFRDTQKHLAITRNEITAAERKIKDLKAQLGATATPTKALTRAFDDAKAKASELSQRHDQLIERAQRIRTALDKEGISTSKLAEHQRRLSKEIAEANKRLDAQKLTMERHNKVAQMQAAAKAGYAAAIRTRNNYANAGTTLGLAAGATMAGLSVPVRAFTDAEDAATGLKGALMDARGQIPPVFNDINALATRLGDRLPGTTADYQNMMTMLIRQGMSAKTILGGLGEATAYLGVQLKMPMDQAAEFASKMQDATRTSEQDMMALMDTIQKTYYLGVDSGNMLNAFAKLSPALDTIKQKGLAGARAMAPLVVMADQADLHGEAAGNAFRKVFQMAMDAEKVAKGSKLAGVNLNFTDGKGEFGGLDNMFAQLEKLKNLDTVSLLKVQKAIFGDDGETLQAVSLMIEKGAAGYAEVQKKMADQASLQQRVNQQLGTLRNLWDAASGTFTNALVKFGEALAPDLKSLTTWIGEMSEKLGKWSAAHPELTKWIMRSAAALGALFAATSGIALIIAAVVGPFAMASSAIGALGGASAIGTGAITALTGAFGGLKTVIMMAGRALLTTPIGWVLAGVAILIYKYWEPISAFLGGVWEGFSAGVRPVIDIVQQLYEALQPVLVIFQPLIERISQVAGWFLELIAPVSLTTEQFGAATEAGKTFGSAIAATFNLALTPVRTMIALVGILLGQLVTLSQAKVLVQSGEFSAAWDLIKKNGSADWAKLTTPETYFGHPTQAGTPAQDPVSTAPYKPVMAAGAGAGTYAPVYHITLPPIPGATPKDHANAVADEIARRERENKARSRAKMGDHE